MYKNFPSADEMGRHMLVVESGGKEIARFLLLAPVIVGQESQDSDGNQQSYWSGGILGEIPDSEIRYIDDPDDPTGVGQPYVLMNGDWEKKGKLHTSTVAHRITIEALVFLRNILLAHLTSYVDDNVAGSNLTETEPEDFKKVTPTLLQF